MGTRDRVGHRRERENKHGSTITLYIELRNTHKISLEPVISLSTMGKKSKWNHLIYQCMS